MELQINISSEEMQIQELLGDYLNMRVAGCELSAEAVHLDEDSLSAFVEGSLGQRETLPIVNHLADCSFCRNVTSELVKLDMTFAEEEFQNVVKLESPSKISQVLSSVLTRIFGSNDGAVFAHQEEDAESENPEADEKD